jgi:hypothetical protein
MQKLNFIYFSFVLIFCSCIRFVEVDKTIRKVSRDGEIVEVNIQRLKAWDNYYCTKIAHEVYERRDRVKGLLDSYYANNYQASKISYLVADTIHLTFPIDSNYMIIKFQVFKGLGGGWLNRDRKFNGGDGNKSDFIETYNRFHVEVGEDTATNLYKYLPQGLSSQSSSSVIMYYPIKNIFYSYGHFAYIFNGNKEDVIFIYYTAILDTTKDPPKEM